MGEELCDWTREHLEVEIKKQYGQTECDLVVCFCSEVMNIVPGAIGKAVPGHVVEILGVPDETRGEIVKAYIVPKEGIEPDKALKESIKQHVKTEQEAHVYPREVESLQKMPMTKTAKIFKQELRKMHRKKVGQSETSRSGNAS